MKKIKLVFSDFHLGKGRYLEDGSINPVEDFIYGDKFIEYIRYYSEGDYHDYEVELIINGDFFNMLMPIEGDELPEIITEEKAVRIINEIMNGHEAVMDVLKQFAGGYRHSVCFIVGNHDQGLLWDGVQRAIRARISPSVKFHRQFYTFEGIYIEHGNQAELLNHFNPRKIDVVVPTYPEPVQDISWASYFVLKFLDPMKKNRPYIDRIRPFRAYIRWALLNDTLFAIVTIIRLIIFNFSSHFHLDPVRRKRYVPSWRDIMEAFMYKSVDSLARNILKNTSYHTVIFGHTHQYKYWQLTKDKEYFNTGTWNEGIRLDLGNLGRVTKLTYVIIEYKDSRPRAKLKEWHGKWRVEEDVNR